MEDYRRVMEMVGELHRLGYGRLRLMALLSPSGCHWRGLVAPVGHFKPDDGAELRDYDAAEARYTTGDGDRFFGWVDAAGDTPVELARKFVARFPDTAEAGCGTDPAYERWYAEMLEATAPDGAVWSFDDGERYDDRMLTNLGDREVFVPRPPLPPRD